MRILLTNTSLVERGGSELYIRDVALALLRRGHQPLVYSPRLGAVAAEIRTATVPVVDRLEALGAPPDLIHGQHHLETMTALSHFSQVPAVFFSHGWQPWQEAPPRFPRIMHYVAVDDTVRDRLVDEHGIPPEQVRTILNFVDLEKFRLRPQLPERPRRALLFGNFVQADYHQAIAAACARHGIALDTAGRDTGTAVARPELILPTYDLVFAKARAALEAMATGAAVIVASPDGAGPLVTRANFDQLRRFNFGIRTLARPITVDHFSAEIVRYDPAEARAVGVLIQQSAGLEQQVTQIIEVYEQALAKWRTRQPAYAAEPQATAAYLAWLSSRGLESLLNHIRHVEAAYQAQQQQNDALQEANQVLITEHNAASLVQRQEHQTMQQMLQTKQEEQQAIQQMLQMRQEEIQAMRQTRGWRLLSRWWQVKRRLTRQHSVAGDADHATR